MGLMEFQLKALSADIAYLGGGDVVARIMRVSPQQVYQWQINPCAITYGELRMIEMLAFVKKRAAGLSEQDYEEIEQWIEEEIFNSSKEL